MEVGATTSGANTGDTLGDAGLEGFCVSKIHVRMVMSVLCSHLLLCLINARFCRLDENLLCVSRYRSEFAVRVCTGKHLNFANAWPEAAHPQLQEIRDQALALDARLRSLEEQYQVTTKQQQQQQGTTIKKEQQQATTTKQQQQQRATSSMAGDETNWTLLGGKSVESVRGKWPHRRRSKGGEDNTEQMEPTTTNGTDDDVDNATNDTIDANGVITRNDLSDNAGSLCHSYASIMEEIAKHGGPAAVVSTDYVGILDSIGRNHQDALKHLDEMCRHRLFMEEQTAAIMQFLDGDSGSTQRSDRFFNVLHNLYNQTYLSAAVGGLYLQTLVRYLSESFLTETDIDCYIKLVAANQTAVAVAPAGMFSSYIQPFVRGGNHVGPSGELTQQLLNRMNLKDAEVVVFPITLRYENGEPWHWTFARVSLSGTDIDASRIEYGDSYGTEEQKITNRPR